MKCCCLEAFWNLSNTLVIFFISLWYMRLWSCLNHTTVSSWHLVFTGAILTTTRPHAIKFLFLLLPLAPAKESLLFKWQLSPLQRPQVRAYTTKFPSHTHTFQQGISTECHCNSHASLSQVERNRIRTTVDTLFAFTLSCNAWDSMSNTCFEAHQWEKSTFLSVCCETSPLWCHKVLAKWKTEAKERAKYIFWSTALLLTFYKPSTSN